MACYIVSFETNSEEARQRVIERLKTYSAYCPINKNCWALVVEKKAVDVHKHIADVMDSTDKLFVVRSGTEAAWRNSYGPKHDEWLKKNL